MALAQAPVSWPFILLGALPVLLWLIDGTARARSAFWIGWAAGAGFFVTAMFWIVDPFFVEPDVFAWMAPFALVGVTVGLALFWAVPFALARALWRPGPRRVFILAALWTASEYARGHVLTGFPWALQAYAWTETPVAQIDALSGPYFLSFLTLVAGLLVAAGTWRGPAAALALVALGWSGGLWRLAQPMPVRADPVLVRMVQPNAEQDQKWLPGMEAEFYQRHLTETRARSDPMPDITIWSETAVPFILNYQPELQREIAQAVGPSGHLMLGIQRVDVLSDRQDWFNSLVVLGRNGVPEAVYDKHHLVPFGEYIPWAGLLGRLGLPALTTLTQAGFAAGPGPRTVSVPGVPRFLPLICYEAIFPQGVSAPGPRPDWIVQITNDAWFGKLSGPYQHLAQARMRAIEQGLPLVRAANTGVSAMIDGRGRVTASLDLGREGHVDAYLPAPLAPTIYGRFGDGPGLLLIVAIFGLTYLNFSDGNFWRLHR